MVDPSPDAAALRSELRAAGLRATVARVAILRALRAAPSPQSHADLEDTLRGEPWNRTTIYRNLLDLARAGLARRFDVGDRVWRFEARRREQDDHPHFVCSACGEIECLDGVDLAFAGGADAPAAVRAHDVEVRVAGVCDRCR